MVVVVVDIVFIIHSFDIHSLFDILFVDCCRLLRVVVGVVVVVGIVDGELLVMMLMTVVMTVVMLLLVVG